MAEGDGGQQNGDGSVYWGERWKKIHVRHYFAIYIKENLYICKFEGTLKEKIRTMIYNKMKNMKSVWMGVLCAVWTLVLGMSGVVYGQGTCTPVGLPIVEDFETTDSLPRCWERWENFDAEAWKAHIVGSPVYRGEGALMVSCGADATNEHQSIVMMPQLQSGPAGARLKMWVRANQAGTLVVVGVCSSTGIMHNFFNFEPVDTIRAAVANQWVQYEVDFSGYSGSGDRMALRMIEAMQGGATGRMVYVDEMTVERCMVRDLRVSHRSDDELTLHWTQTGGGTADLSVDAAGGGNAARVSGVSSPYRITGLTAGTRYVLTLTPRCEGESLPGISQSLEATTLAGPRGGLVYCEGFEGTTLPEKWTGSGASTSNTRRLEGSRSLLLNGSGTRAVLPRIALGSGTAVAVKELMVSLWAYGGSGVMIEIGATNYPEEDERTAIDTLTLAAGQQWTLFTRRLNGYTGTEKYLVLRAIGGSVNVDKMRVGRCLVDGVALVDYTTTTATIEWEAPQTGGQVAVVAVSGGGSSATVAAGDCTVEGGKWRYTLRGLTPGTAYTYAVRGACDEEECAPTVAFTTYAQEYHLPYCNDFEQSGTLPTDWRVGQAVGSSPMVSNTRQHSGTQALRMNAVSGQASIVVLPPIAMATARDVVVSFAAWASAAGSSVEVGVMSDVADASSFSASGGSVAITAGSWVRYSATVSGYQQSDGYLALRYRSSGTTEGWIDDLEASYCGVSRMAVGTVHGEGATLTWNSTGSGQTQIAIYKSGSAAQRLIASATSPQEVDNLESGMTYTYYVRSICGADTGCWLYGGSFTTTQGNLQEDYCIKNAFNVGASGWTSNYLDADNYTGLYLSYDYLGTGSVTAGVMSDANVASSFFTIDGPRNGSSTEWRHVQIPLAGNESHGHYLGLRQSGGAMQVRRLRVSRGSLTDVAVGQISSTSATITWGTEGAVDSVRIMVGQTEVTVAGVNSYTFTGLTPGTSYTYVLTAINRQSAHSCSVDEGTLTTLNAEIAEGLCEDFSASNYGTLPTGWKAVESVSSTPSLYTTGGSRWLRMTSTAANSAMVAMPAATVALNGLMLRVRIYATGSDVDASMVVVGIMTDAGDASSFVAVDTLRPSTTAQWAVADLRRYTGTGRVIAMRYVSSGGQRTVYIGQLSLATQQVGEVTADRVTNHSVRLRWTPPTAVAITYDGQTMQASGGEAVVDGLSADRVYTIGVTPTANSSGCGTTSKAVHTLPEAMLLPLCAGMESYDSDTRLPVGWKMLYGGEAWSQTAQTAEGSRAIQMRSGNGVRTLVVSPWIEGGSVQGMYIAFYLKNDANGTVEVGVMSDETDTSTFVALQQYSGATDWVRKELLASGVGAGARYVAFRLKGAGGTANAYVDHLMVQSCPMPTAVSLTNPRKHSLELHWTGATDSVMVECGAQRLRVGTSPYTIEGLTANTLYQVKVWPICSAGSTFECHKDTASMRTLPEDKEVTGCYPITGNSLPDGWRAWTDGSISITSATPDRKSAIRLTAAAGGTATAVMPGLEREPDCSELDTTFFSFSVVSGGSGTLELGVVTDVVDMNSFSAKHQIDLSTISTSQWTDLILGIPADTLELGFAAFRIVAPNGASAAMILGDVCTDRCMVTDADSTAITPRTITFEWKKYGNCTITVSYNGQTDTLGESPQTITGLTPNKFYTFVFEAICPCDHPAEKSISLTVQMPAEPMVIPTCYTADTSAVGGCPVEWRRHGGVSGSYPQASRQVAYSGNQSLDFYASSGSPQTLAFDPLPDGTTFAVVSMRIYCTSEDMANSNRFSIGLVSDAMKPETFTALQSFSIEATDTWKTVHAAISNPAERYIALRFSPSGTYHVYVEDISVSTCGIESVAYDGSNIDIVGLGSPSAYQIKATNLESHTVRTVTRSETHLPITAIGLSADSAYGVTVAAVCTEGGVSSCTADSLTFGQRIALPYCEEFAEATLHPEGWEVRNRMRPRGPRIENGRYHFYNGDIVELPLLPIGTTAGGLYLRLDRRVSNQADAYNTELEIGYMDGGSFTSLTTLTSPSINTTFYATLPACSAIRIALRAHSMGGNREQYIDNLQITRYPEPPEVRLTETGYRQQHIYWDNTANNAHYDIEWGAAGFTRGTGTRLHSDSCHAVFAPLQANTRYEYYFIDDDGNYFCWPHTFTSLPAAVNIPYCDNAQHTLGNGTLYIFPEVLTRVNKLTLLLTWRTTQSGRLVIGTLTDRADATTFTPIDTLYPAAPGVDERSFARLNNYADTGHFIAIRFDGATGYVSQISLQAVPQPTFRVLSSGDIQVNTSASPIDYYLRICRRGTAQSSGTIKHITSACDTITGLTMYTEYDIYIVDGADATTCAPATILRTHLDISTPYCATPTTIPTGWMASGRYRTMPNFLIDSIAKLHLYLKGSGMVEIGVCSHLDDTSDYVPLTSLALTSDSQHVYLYDYRATIGRLKYIVFKLLSGASISSVVAQTIANPEYEVLSSSSIQVRMPGASTVDYYVEVCPRGTAQGRGTVVHITQPVQDITGLQMFTWYDLYARADESIATCATPVPLRTHLDIEPPYCSEGNYTGWYVAGRYHGVPYVIIGSMSQLYVTFVSRGEATIGIQTKLADTNSFTPLTSFNNTTWDTHTVRLSDYAPLIAERHYISIRGGELSSLYLHTCPQPSLELTEFNTITFTLAEPTADYWIEYNDTIVHATTTPFHLTHLRQNTDYSFRIRCDSATAACMPAKTMTTGVQLTLPHCTSMNGYTIGSGKPARATHPGWFALTGTSGDRYTIMPIIDLDHASRLYLRLRYRIGQSGTALKIGIMEDYRRENTFTPITTISTSTAAYQELVVDFASYTGTGLYVAFVASGSSPDAVYLDRIELQTVPFATYLVTDHNQVLVSAPGMSQPSRPFYILYNGNRQLATSLPQLITGLADDTEYSFNLQDTAEGQPCNTATSIRTTHLSPAPLCYSTITLTQNSPLWRGPQLDEANIASLLARITFQPNTTGTTVAIGMLRIYNADTSFVGIDTIVANAASATHYIDFSRYQSGKFIAFKLISGASAQLSAVSIDRCHVPSGITLSLKRHNIVHIDYDHQTPLSNLRLEYGPQGFPLGTGTTLQLTSLPIDLTLANSTTYDFHFLCSGSSSTCDQPLSIRTLDPPPVLSWCEDFDSYTAGSLPPRWRTALTSSSTQQIVLISEVAHTSSLSLKFHSNYGRSNIALLPDLGLDSLKGLSLSLWMYAANAATSKLEVGYLTDPYDPESFATLHTFTSPTAGTWQRLTFDLDEVPATAIFIALRCSGTEGTNTFYLDDLFISQCGVNDFAISQVENTQISFRWRQTGSPTITLQITPEGDTPRTLQIPTTSDSVVRTYTASGLQPLTNYTFIFSATCNAGSGYCTTDYHDTIRVFTPAGGSSCIDHTNLLASYTTCFYGTYTNPYANTGVVDNGYRSSTSRHTIHYDLTERDPRTGGALATVPAGAIASVRLGNWTANRSVRPGQAESIVYGLNVDTTEFDLLTMKYAAVLQDPMHATADQPRFSLELLDSTMQLIDPLCGRADFIADYNMGWNIVPGTSGVLWKDWTTVGVDLSPYHGRSIYVRLTTRDCNEGSHYGYAYFTLECGNKNIITGKCGNAADNELTAPEGFNYRWYTSTSDQTLSTERTISVPSRNDIYYLCDVSFIENPACKFTISAFAGTRFPRSQFTYSVQLAPCSFDVDFTNQSTVTIDGLMPVTTDESVETNRWIFDNGTDTVRTFNATAHYTAPGTYNVSLITGIASDQCLDTLTIPLNLTFPTTDMRIEGPAERCRNAAPSTLHLYNVDRLLATSHPWQLADSALVGTHWLKHYTTTVDSLSFSAATHTFRVQAIDSVGCTISLAHTLTVHPVYHIHDRLRLCSLLMPYAWRDTTINATNTHPIDTSFYRIHRTSIHSCDSVMTLTLMLHDNAHFTPRDTLRDYLCDNRTYFFSDSLLTPDRSLTFNRDGATSTIIYTDSLHSSIGCDSLSTIILTVHPTYEHHLYDTACSNLDYRWGTPERSLFTPGSTTAHLHATDTSATFTFNLPPLTSPDLSASDLLHSQFQCDSLSTLHLHLLPAYDLHFYDTLCDAHLDAPNWIPHTYRFMTETLNATGTYPVSRTTATTPTSPLACDSIRTLHLKVYPTYDLHLYDTIYDGDEYRFETLLLDTTGIYPQLLHTIPYTCDSLRTLHLQRNRRTLIDTLICGNTLPLDWTHHDSHQTLTTHFTTSTATHHPSGWQIIKDSIHLTGREGIDSLLVMTVIARDTSSTTDPVHACDSLRWRWNKGDRYIHSYNSRYTTDTTYRTSTTEPYVSLYQEANLDTTGLHAYLPSPRLEPYALHLSPSYNLLCDSVRHLALTLNHTHFATDRRQACDSLVWINHRTYRASITGHAGPVGSHQADGPVDTIPTAGGCDSVITLDLTIHHSTFEQSRDTFCYNQTYTWRGSTVGRTDSAHWHTPLDTTLSVTLRTSHGCDSVISIRLAQMAQPILSIHDTLDCSTRTYTLNLLSNVPYIQWTSSADPTFLSHHPTLAVAPTQTTIYQAYTDYHRTPLCPATATVALNPIIVPDATIEVTPEILNYKNMTLNAYDRSGAYPYSIHPDDPPQWVRQWWLDRELLPYSGAHLSHDVSHYTRTDTVRLILSIFNGQCSDTAMRLVPIRRVTLYAPNAFTPGESDNNTFSIVSQGITDAHLIIYNREGLLIWQTTDLSIPWDGRRTDGTPCQQGSYVWKLTYRAIDYPERLQSEVGSILLLR